MGTGLQKELTALKFEFGKQSSLQGEATKELRNKNELQVQESYGLAKRNEDAVSEVYRRLADVEREIAPARLMTNLPII